MKIPKSGKELLQLLHEANMPATDADGLKAIAAIEGKTFPSSIVKYLEGNPSAETKEYVDTVLAAVSSSTRDLLAGWGYAASPMALLDVAKREISSFRETLCEAERGDDNARAYLIDLLSQYDAIDILRTVPQTRKPAARPAERPNQSNANGNSRNAGSPAEPQTHPPTSQGMYGEAYRVYGSSAALCVCECTTKIDSKPTVMFETAKKESGAYEWIGKRSVMLTQGELPLVLAVFLGILPKVDIVGHGKKQEKWMTIEDQQHQIYVKTTYRGESPRGVPVPSTTVSPIIAMLFRQFSANHPRLSDQILLQIVHRAAGMYANITKDN